jgi:hypothetical protein
MCCGELTGTGYIVEQTIFDRAIVVWRALKGANLRPLPCEGSPDAGSAIRRPDTIVNYEVSREQARGKKRKGRRTRQGA